VPWQDFLGETAGDVNEIWKRLRDRLPRRVAHLVKNVELLRKSAEDARHDGRQWAAASGGEDPRALGEYLEIVDGYEVESAGAITHNIGITQRLMDILRSAVGGREITASSTEIRSLLDRLWHFQSATLGRDEEALGAEEFADPFVGVTVAEGTEKDVIVPA
jgi:hypothetical protein